LGALFASGRIVDMILALMVIEAMLLALYRRGTGHGPVLADMMPTLLAGFALLAALRCALAGWWWGWIGACLAAALAAHVADLSRRWR
jgi:hypothetical protein